MKITYLKYWVEYGGNKYRWPAGDLLKAFAGIKEPGIRSSFKSGDDNIFIFPSGQHVYLFVVTKDDELIKAISADTIKQADIGSRLEKNERIGFASYVYMGNDFIGIASTIHGPKIKRFTDLVNGIFRRCEKDDYQYCCAPFSMSVDVKHALKFSFKGSVKFEIKRGAPLFDTIIAAWNSPQDVDRMVIEMYPQMKSSMENTFNTVVNGAVESGVSKLIVRARDELEDQMMDYYVVGNGKMSRVIQGKKEEDICFEMQQDVAKNSLLKEALHDYRIDTGYEKTDLKELCDLCSGDSLARMLAVG